MLLSKKALRDEIHGRHMHDSSSVFFSLAFLLKLSQNGHRIRGSRRHIIQQVVHAEMSHFWEEEDAYARYMAELERQMRADMAREEEEYDPFYDLELDFPSCDYNVHCMNCGHVWSPERGSELEKRCIKNASRGFIDALHVNSHECPRCIEESERQVARMTGYDLDNHQFNSEVA